jgi:hypothetical protein
LSKYLILSFKKISDLYTHVFGIKHSNIPKNLKNHIFRIFSYPLRLVEKTANAELAYCAYVWLKYDLCLQHFRTLFDARRRGFQMKKDNEEEGLFFIGF